MKTARRHELRENDLAQHLGSLADTLRQNGLIIGLCAAVVVVIVVAAVMFANSRAEAVHEAWRTINQGPLDAKTPDDRIARYKELADQNVSPTATALSIKAAADQAIAAMNDARMRGDAASVKRYRDQAAQFYQELTRQHDQLLAVAGAARLGLAYIAEDTGDYGAAQLLYQAIMKEPRFRDTPFAVEAEYREKNLGKWKTAIAFAPATRPATAPSTAPSTAAATRPAVAVPMSLPQMRAATQPAGLTP